MFLNSLIACQLPNSQENKEQINRYQQHPTQHYSPVYFSTSKLSSRSRTCWQSPFHYSYITSNGAYFSFTSVSNISAYHYSLQPPTNKMFYTESLYMICFSADCCRSHNQERRKFSNRRSNSTDGLLIWGHTRCDRKMDVKKVMRRSYNWSFCGLNTS